MKRGTEDLDYFIGDEAIAIGAGPGKYLIPLWVKREWHL